MGAKVVQVITRVIPLICFTSTMVQLSLLPSQLHLHNFYTTHMLRSSHRSELYCLRKTDVQCPVHLFNNHLLSCVHFASPMSSPSSDTIVTSRSGRHTKNKLLNYGWARLALEPACENTISAYLRALKPTTCRRGRSRISRVTKSESDGLSPSSEASLYIVIDSLYCQQHRRCATDSAISDQA